MGRAPVPADVGGARLPHLLAIAPSGGDTLVGMSDFENEVRSFIAKERTVPEFQTYLEASSSPRVNPFLGLLAEYENSIWSEPELRARAADLFTQDRNQ